MMRITLSTSLMVTTLITVLLLVSNREPWTNSGDFYLYVVNNRSTVSLFVQIIAQTLGALHVYTLCTLVLFRTGQRLADTNTSYTLDRLQFWSSVAAKQLDWALPVGYIFLLLVFRILTVAPAALWAGALSPVRTSILDSSTQTIDVPKYGADSQYIWGHLDWLYPMLSKRTLDGVFSYSPNYDLLGLILAQAASASNFLNDNQTARKLDNTRYSYVSRSYGVGSSVGLVDKNIVGDTGNVSSSYVYRETGYSTQLKCTVNETSNWSYHDTPNQFTDGLPNLYFVQGTLANGISEGYAACQLGSKGDRAFALVGSLNPANNKTAFAIATKAMYAAFDKVQCTVDFVPTMFSINVTTTDRLISVTPIQDAENITDMDPSNLIRAITMRMPTSFSQQHACDLYTSLIGDTFVQNVQTIHQSFASNISNTNDTGIQDKAIRGVQDTLTSMLDNSLLALSTAQLMIPHDVDTVPVSSSLIAAVRIGDSRYIYGIAGINFFIVLIALVETARTRAWKQTGEFDFTRAKDLIVAVARGGMSIPQNKAEIGKHRVHLSESSADEARLVSF